MKLIIFSVGVLLLSSCSHPKAKQDDGIGEWSSIKITLNHHRMIYFINHDSSDSTEVRTYDVGSFFHPVKEVKVKKEKFAFTQAEKDSAYSFVKDMLVHPVKPKSFCTDYVGTIQISISYGDQITQSCSYTSVCDWTELSPQTLKLNSLLKKRIKEM